jgi:ABC-2 type transport system permease protein
MLRRCLRLYPRYLAMALKSRLVYRVDWLIGIVGFLLSNICNFFVLYLVMAPVSTIVGWDIAMIMFMYGFYLIPMGVDHLFTDNLWMYGGYYIKDGDLDRILMKPLNPLFQMIAEGFQYEGFGEVILGVAFMASFGSKLSISWSLNNVIPLILCGLFAIPVYTSIKLFTMSVAFYSKRSLGLMSTVYGFRDFARYPQDVYSQGGIFGKVVRNVLLFIIPFGLIVYTPIAFLLFPEKSVPVLWFALAPNMWLLSAAIFLVSSLMFVAAYRFFRFGLRHYESSGS